MNCSLNLIQPGEGGFTLTYMSADYLHGSHTGLPGWIRVKHFTICKKTKEVLGTVQPL